MSPYLRPVAVFQGRDDATTVRVVLRIRRGDQHDVQGQAHPVPLYLDVPLLHQVEQAHLYPLRQVRQLIDGKDAPVGARHQPVVNCQFVSQVASFRHLDGVHLAYQVGDGDVGGRQLLRIPRVPVNPRNGRVVPQLGHLVATSPAYRVVGVAVDFATGYGRNAFVQQVCERPQEAGLGLTAFPQQDDVLPGQDCVLQLGHDGLFEADDALEHRVLPLHMLHKVAAHLFADRYNLVPAPA